MAGDWMKIELELPDKPEVHSMAGILNVDTMTVVGGLIKVWGWFNKHTTDGNAHSVTFALPDRLTGVTGFGEAMMFVGWLEQNDKTLSMPKFDRHTSESAKSRALGAARTLKSRNKSNGECNGVSVTESLHDRQQEKRREEKNIYTPPIGDELLTAWKKVRKAKRAGEITELAFRGIEREAAKAGITPEQAIAICVERSWISFDSSWVTKREQSRPIGGNSV